MERRYIDNMVSVITPVYNAERFISEMIESVLKQTYKSLEIILIDDCSSDSSAKIIQDYCKRYESIIYHLQEKNMGAAVARNRALELARGQYVAFLDSDDIWKPEKLERQIKLAQKKNATFLYTAIEMIDETGNVIKEKRNVEEQFNYKKLLKNTMLATSTIIVDRKQLGDFRMPLQRSGQDYATWLQLLRNGAIAYGINEALVQYRVSRGSLSSNKFKSVKQVWQIQVNQEKISPIRATYNTCWFIWNALKKYVI